MILWDYIYIHILGDTVGSVPDHCSKAIIVIKQATNLLKKKKKCFIKEKNT